MTALEKVREKQKYKKYEPLGIEGLIDDLKDLYLTKNIALLIIQKYGYIDQAEYILDELGFDKDKNSTKRKKVTKHVKKQAELFDVLFNVHRECFIKIRNRSTNESRVYSVEALKDPYRLQAILKSKYFSNDVDMMYSLNCFNNMYKADENSLFSLQNIAIDVDFDKEKYTLNEVKNIIKEKVKNEEIPAPNVIEEGNRIRLLYTIRDVPVTKKSLIVYKKVADKIASKLHELNASPQPATTFARIENSINSKNNARINTTIITAIPYMLKNLQKKMLDEKKQVTFRKFKKGKVISIPNYYKVNLLRLEDLEKIQMIRSDDYKKRLCYLYRNYCLLANMTEDEALERTLQFNNNFKEPWKVNELDSDTKHLNRKQYLHTGETIIKLLDITREEEEQVQLSTITSKEEYRKRDRAYQKKKYREKLIAEGKTTKKEQLDEIRQKIKALKEKGFKNKDIAQELKLPIKTLERHITHMKKNGLL